MIMYTSHPKKNSFVLSLSFITLASILITGCASVRTTAISQIGGKGMAYYRSGSRGPAVILQSGLGDGKDTWSSLIEAMDTAHIVFAYDRPGYGDSEQSEAPRDPCTIAKELHHLLESASIAPPYLLVGHSIGGLYQYVFAGLYPGEVAGMLLLDPTHPQHWKRMQEDAPAMAARIRLLKSTLFGSSARREFDDQEACMERPGFQLPDNTHIRMLTRTRFDLSELGSFESMTHALESDWQKLLGIKQIEPVEGAGHYIHRDRPDIVIRAIDELMSQVPGPQSGSR
jgi:pimeloyl-ACP methyl ester carboxylesterase